MKSDWIKYKPNEVKDLPSDVGGIYIYVKPIFDNSFEEIVYVGQTNDFNRRHNYEHLGAQENNIELKRFLENNSKWSMYIKEVDSSQMNGMEKYIYDCYLPKFNYNCPPGESPIECILPESVVC